jgi:hypothetical protein
MKDLIEEMKRLYEELVNKPFSFEEEIDLEILWSFINDLSINPKLVKREKVESFIKKLKERKNINDKS